jgi:hypothetical protein
VFSAVEFTVVDFFISSFHEALELWQEKVAEMSCGPSMP